MKTEIKKAKSTAFEPFEVVIQIENNHEALILLSAIQRGLFENDELREKYEWELKRQGWEI